MMATTRCHAALIDGPGQDTRVDAVYEDLNDARVWVDSVGLADGIAYLQEVDYVPAESTAPPVPEGLDLDMLAADISKMLSRYGYDEWGLEDIGDDEIRAALPAFITTCLAHAAANPS